MRNGNALLNLVVVGAAALLVAMPAAAADPVPAMACTTPNGWRFTTDGPTPCGSNTCITYTVSKTSITSSSALSGGGSSPTTPDHVFTFVRAEAGAVTSPTSSISLPNSPCGGDSVLGIAGNAICHERIVRVNNISSKATMFTFSVSGKRLPITTSIGAKKGSSQGACPIVGIGFEDTSSDSCIQSCGAQNEFSARASQVYSGWQFGPDPDDICVIVDHFAANGNFLGSTVTTPVVCGVAVGAFMGDGPQPVTDLDAAGGTVQFGDGVFVTTASPPCQTKLINGTYRQVCKSP